VTRLETLVLSSIAGLILVLALVTPVTFKVAGAGAGVATSAALEIVAVDVQATATSTTAIDGHALAAAMSTAAATVGTLGNGDLESGRGGSALVFFVGSRGRGEREAGGGSLLLGNFSGLLSIGESQRVSPLVTASRTTSAATSAASVLPSVTLGGLEVSKVGPSSAGGRRGRRAHSHIGHCRLITAM
jgi:hypothetical protein